MDFSLKKEANPLLTVFNKTDYDRFKAEFTTKIPISTYVGNTSKSYLARVEGTENKKQMIKLIKEEVMAVGDTKGSQRKLWVLKVMKLFYVTLTSLDFATKILICILSSPQCLKTCYLTILVIASFLEKQT